MNRIITITVLLSLAVANVSIAQNLIEFRILDNENLSPVVGAHIYDSQNKVLATTNAKGVFNMRVGTDDVRFRISHVAYTDSTFVVNSPDYKIVLLLEPLKQRLNVFSVHGNPVDLIPDKPWFVSSYLHHGEGLLLLAFPQKRLTRQTLFLMDRNMDVVASTPWREQGVLFRDAAGDIWLRGAKNTRAIIVENDEIIIGEEVIPSISFDAGIARIEQKIGSNYYFGHYTFDNQRLDYYCYNDKAKRTYRVATIADKLGLTLRETRDIFETNDFERRFGEMCFFAPLFAPIAQRNAEVVIFNYVYGEIMFFDTTGLNTGSTPVSYHKTAKFRKLLLHDEYSHRFYAVFEERGLFSIREINIYTGELAREITIPSFPYIEQISVQNGKLYFLYKEKKEYEYKKIYMMVLPDPQILQKEKPLLLLVN